jgi:hypothetical protein
MGCGSSYCNAIKRELPHAEVKHKYGPPLSFSVAVNGKRAVSPGVITLLGGSPKKVAKDVATAAKPAGPPASAPPRRGPTSRRRSRGSSRVSVSVADAT